VDSGMPEVLSSPPPLLRAALDLERAPVRLFGLLGGETCITGDGLIILREARRSVKAN
jgi:hypothetical protein